MAAERVPTCVWRVSSELVIALDERFGEPVDAYVNGSQVWLRDDGPGGTTLEWRLHPVAGFARPAGCSTYDLFPRVAFAVARGEPPLAPPESLWDRLEAFPAFPPSSPAEELEPARPAARRQRPGRPRGDRRRLGGVRRPHLDRRRAAAGAGPRRPLVRSAPGLVAPPERLTGGIELDLDRLAPDGGEGHVPPPLDAGDGRRQLVLGEPADVGALEGVGGQLAADGAAGEDERVQRDAGEPEPQAVEHGDEALGHAFDAGLLADLLHRHLGRRVAHVGPPRRVEPDTGV